MCNENNLNIEQNKSKFLMWFNHYVNRKGKEELIAYLENSDFFTAPASAKNHLAVPGGLCQHSINVAKVLGQIMTTPGTAWYNYAVAKGITIESCMIIGLLHDLCKINFYNSGTKSQKVYDADVVAEAIANREYVKHDDKGDFVWKNVPCYEVNDQEPMGHGENSLIRILENGGLELTPDEKYAIRWHMGFSIPKEEWGTLNSAMDISPIVMAVNFADVTATHLLEVEANANLVETGAQMVQQKMQEAAQQEAAAQQERRAS